MEIWKLKKLPPSFYQPNVVQVAQALLGCFIVRQHPLGRIVARISEVEAYDSKIDKASHAWGNKRTARNEPMFCEGGIAYVYFIYGMHYCLNVVTGSEGDASAVLVRGAQIIEGQEIAAQLRYGKSFNELATRQVRALSDGPGKLCKALGIDRDFDYESLLGDRLYLCDEIDGQHREVGDIKASKRIGIDYAEEAVDFLWRFEG